jgi:hypothetical protein
LTVILDPIHNGDLVPCGHCGKAHRVVTTGDEPPLQVIRCDHGVTLVGIRGAATRPRLLVGYHHDDAA